MASDIEPDNQLRARPPWEKQRRATPADTDLHAAHESLEAATAVLDKEPDNSGSTGRERTRAEMDWAVGSIEGSPHDRYVECLTPVPGRVYVGPIVDSRFGTIYQSTVQDGRQVLIAHKRLELHSDQSNAFARNSGPVKIHYVGKGVGIGTTYHKSPAEEEREHSHKHLSGISR